MTDKVELIAPCHFGLEAVLKREIQDLGYEITEVEDGRVTFKGDIAAVCRANLFLRTAERVLVKAGSFRAESFEEDPMGGLYPKRRKVLGLQGGFSKEQAFQPVRYPVDHEEGYGEAAG